jgi:hypothetical protein
MWTNNYVPHLFRIHCTTHRKVLAIRDLTKETLLKLGFVDLWLPFICLNGWGFETSYAKCKKIQGKAFGNFWKIVFVLLQSHDVRWFFEIKVQECLVHYIPTL